MYLIFIKKEENKTNFSIFKHYDFSQFSSSFLFQYPYFIFWFSKRRKFNEIARWRDTYTLLLENYKHSDFGFGECSFDSLMMCCLHMWLHMLSMWRQRGRSALWFHIRLCNVPIIYLLRPVPVTELGLSAELLREKENEREIFWFKTNFMLLKMFIIKFLHPICHTRPFTPRHPHLVDWERRKLRKNMISHSIRFKQIVNYWKTK